MRKMRVVAMVTAAVMTLSCFIGIFTVNAAAFEPAGEVFIDWNANATEQITLDGRLKDWDTLGADIHDLTSHFAAWKGEVPDDFSMQVGFVADNDYLYIGLEITDKDFSPIGAEDNNGASVCRGDALQFGIDMFGVRRELMDVDPEFLTGNAANNSAFSFAPQVNTGECVFVLENTADIIPPQNGLGTDQLYCARATETVDGWNVEVRFSWNYLFENMERTCWLEDQIYFDSINPLYISMLINYSDRDEIGGEIVNGFGTFASAEAAAASCRPHDNGIKLKLRYSPDMDLSIQNSLLVQGTKYPFEPAGNLPVHWLVKPLVIDVDGDLTEWSQRGIAQHDLTEHFTAWVGEVPADFTAKASFAADMYYLYIALDITDKDFSPVDPTDTEAIAAYKGDAVRFGVDFGGMQRDVIESPGYLAMADTYNTYFSYAPCENTSECTVVSNLSNIYENGPLDAEEYGNEVYAASSETKNGWCTEFRIAWNSLFDNMAKQMFLEESYTFDAAHPLEVSLLLCYLDMDEKGTDYTNAMGTFRSMDDASATPKPSANGLNLRLTYEEGRVIYINDERFVQVEEIPWDIGVCPPGTTEESKSETEDEPTAPVEPSESTGTETTAGSTQADRPTTESEGTGGEPSDTVDGGCGAAVAAGVLTLPVALLGVAILSKKNKQD